MLLLSLLLACSDPPPGTEVTSPSDAELHQTWQGIPLRRGWWPDWLPEDASRSEGVSQADGGPRKAHRIAAPRPTSQGLGLGEGDASWTVDDRGWEAKVVPADGPARTWRLSFEPDPPRVAGTPQHLSPSGADVVAVVSPAEVQGVIDLGHQAFAFSCLGVGADMSPDGWCLQLFSRLYAESWSESP